MTENLTVYQQAKISDEPIDVCEYAFLVKRIAHHMMARMPSSVQVDDLIQSGMIGLLEAAQKYDGEKGASFETYAGIRIRGAIIDEMRRGDWVPRSVHRNVRKISDTISELEKKLGRDARDYEIAEALGVDLDEYHQMARDGLSSKLFSLDESQEDSEFTLKDSLASASFDPSEELHSQTLTKHLSKVIEQLPERERLVLSLYYDEELNLKEIGLVLGVSESRVSQIHSQAAMRLRAKMSSWTSN